MKTKVLLVLLGIFSLSCSEQNKELPSSPIEVEPPMYLPFQSIVLNDLSSFQKAAGNWEVAESVYVDRSKDRSVSYDKGTGILVNIPQEGKNENLFASFDHGDIELEVDVLMPKGSNSGIYFQGRYEVQLFDSWGVESPQHSDMGGIYQRWDDTKPEGEKGYEGYRPRQNAAKAPGLWQHFKILFHAPKFDSTGKKIKNALFEEVWLNGMLIHENVEVSGPTRASAFTDEKPIGPLMIQGDHGPVALKNMRYKLYGNKKVELRNVKMIEYESASVQLPNLDSLALMREITTDSISANMASGERSQRILKYSGQIGVPDSGDYMFDLKVNGAGGLLLLDRDTVVDLDGDYNLDSLGLGKKTLQKGTVDFTLLYNKHRPWTKGFSLEVEGPGIQKHALTAPNSLDLSQGKPEKEIMVRIQNEPVAQRSFLMHEGEKRTHCISIGTHQKIHYAYDLAYGTLLKAWGGDFLNATQMWHSRGPRQLGVPAGFTISFHGDPEFAQLENEKDPWPDSISENEGRKQLGYEFDKDGMPVFLYKIGTSTITNYIIPSKTLRALHRTISINGNQEVWHKVAAAESIEKLPDGTYIINDESYFIDFSKSTNLIPIIRKSNGTDELLVKFPTGEQKIAYEIIW